MWRLLCAVLVVIATWTPVRAVQISDATQHFFFDTPEDWQPISPAEINAVRGPGSQGILAGARSKGTGVPYCVVQAVSKPPGDSAAYVDKFRKDSESLGVTVTSCAYDTHRHAAVLQGQVTSPAGSVKVISYGFIGKDVVISVIFYDFEADFQRSIPTFEKIADSFRFDSGYGEGSYFPSFGTIVNICVGIVLLALYPVMRRSRRSKSKPIFKGR